MLPLLNGATFMGCVVVALFFLRFWQRTKDRLFIFFAIAFAILGANRISLSVFTPDTDHEPYYYVGRLLAFVTIALAILDKNRRGA